MKNRIYLLLLFILLLPVIASIDMPTCLYGLEINFSRPFLSITSKEPFDIFFCHDSGCYMTGNLSETNFPIGSFIKKEGIYDIVISSGNCTHNFTFDYVVDYPLLIEGEAYLINSTNFSIKNPNLTAVYFRNVSLYFKNLNELNYSYKNISLDFSFIASQTYLDMHNENFKYLCQMEEIPKCIEISSVPVYLNLSNNSYSLIQSFSQSSEEPLEKENETGSKTQQDFLVYTPEEPEINETELNQTKAENQTEVILPSNETEENQTEPTNETITELVNETKSEENQTETIPELNQTNQTEDLDYITVEEELLKFVPEEAEKVSVYYEVPKESQFFTIEEFVPEKKQKFAVVGLPVGWTLSFGGTRIEYETVAPQKEEIKIDGGKRITISSNTSVHYRNITAFTSITENDKEIRLFHLKEDSKIEVTNDNEYEMKYLDLVGDGKIDTLQWIVPKLSTQIFDVVLNFSEYNKTKEENLTGMDPTLKAEYENLFGSFYLETENGKIDLFEVDDELNINFKISNISERKVNVTLTLPIEIPEGIYFYLWKNVLGEDNLVPYTISEDRKRIILNLVDGEIDDDGLINGVIEDPLKLFVPKYKVNITSVNEKISEVNVDNKIFLVESWGGNLAKVNIVDPENVINSPKNPKAFDYKLLKFSIDNLTGEKAEIYLTYEKLPKNPKLYKFNPNTLEWYTFPYEVVNENKIKIVIYDGGFGDDDGIKNGIIEDDLGITAGWWNDSWSWRTAFNMSSTTGNLTDFQVKLELTGSNFNFSHVKSNLSDLRFTYYNSSSDSETEVFYWIDNEEDLNQNYTSGDYNATIWIKAPFIENNANTSYFIYYGNEDAVSESNGSATFIYFLDFENSTGFDYGELTLVQNSSSARNGNYGVSGNGGASYDQKFRSGNSGRDIVVESWVKSFDGGCAQETSLAALVVGHPSGGTDRYGYQAYIDERGTPYYGIREDYSGGKILVSANSPATSYGNWYFLSFTWTSSNQLIFKLYNGNSELMGNINTTTTSYTDGEYGIGAYCGGEWDDFRVRKYSGQEPIVSLVGEEYNGILNISIDQPSESSEKLRSTLFTMNGTVNCTRGKCGNVSVHYEYYATSTPIQTWTETETSDFLNYTSIQNISYTNDQLSLESVAEGAPWWEGSYIYRQELNISNIAGNLTDYQLRIELNSSNVGTHFNWTRDQNATRFVWYNETSYESTNCPYWFEYWNSTASKALVWVKVPFLENNANTTIYLYYGNPSATPGEDPDNTFVVWDDFTGTTDMTFGTSSQSYTTGHDGVSNHSIQVDGGGAYSGIYVPSITIGQGKVIETWGKIPSGNPDTSLGGISFGMQSATSAYQALLDERLNQYDLQMREDFSTGGRTSGSNRGVISVDTWYFMKLIWMSGGTANFYVYQDNSASWNDQGTLFDSATRTDTDYTSGYAGICSYDSFIADEYRVREYASVEPTVASFSSEQEISYETYGEYVSKLFDTGTSEVAYQKIIWAGNTNTNTTMKVYTRTSNGTHQTSWFLESNNSNIQADSNRYIQYKILMNTSNSKQTPTLNEIKIEYKISTPYWIEMNPSFGLFTSNSPYICGELNQSDLCYPTLNVNPIEEGEFSLRMCTNSSTYSEVEEICSDNRTVYVWLQPSIASFTSSEGIVARGDYITLEALLVDEAASPMEGYNLSFYDETGNGTSYYIGSAITNYQGYASLIYTIPEDSLYTEHTMNVSYNGSSVNYIKSIYDASTLSIEVSSKPTIANVTASQSTIGFGYNITITANVTDIVSLDKVLINITNESGIATAYEMQQVNSSDIYQYNFNDSWFVQEYSYRIVANNSNGLRSTSSQDTFSVYVDSEVNLKTEKDTYKNEESVELANSTLFNNGTSNFKGYLKMIVKRWTGEYWENVIPSVLNPTLYTFTSQSSLNLSEEWINEGGWSTSTRMPGWYQVYVVLQDPYGNTLTESNGSAIEKNYNFSIAKAILVVTNLEHENLEDYSLNEYETGDKIEWINITVKPIDNKAYNANITLNLLNSGLQEVGWGPNEETKICGDLLENQECEKKWDNSTNGYYIPLTASSGTYSFYWDVSMETENGDEQFNQSNSFVVHRIPSTFTKVVDSVRVYNPGWTHYNFTFTNLWSSNLTNATIKINCPNISGISCHCIASGNLTCSLGDIGNGSQITIPFNFSTNESVPSEDYSVNITLNYTNPGSEIKSWAGYANKVIEVRNTGILEIFPVEPAQSETLPANFTRSYEYDVNAYINNTGDTNATNIWFNYTLPSGWSVSSGQQNKNNSLMEPYEIFWNNITVSLENSSKLGSKTINLSSSADDGRNDWKTMYVDVYANTTLNYSPNQSLVNRNEKLKLTATLKYDNGTSINTETVYFYDQTSGLYIGSNSTNSQGIASVVYTIPDNASLGYHTFNASFSGDSSIYIWSSSNTTTSDIHRKPTISNISSTPELTGYGSNIYVEARVTDDDDLSSILLKITYPNSTEENFSMSQSISDPEIYYYNFNKTWQLGTYNFTIWANDTTTSFSESNVSNFSISSELEIKIRTLNQSYESNQYVNLTDIVLTWWNLNWTYNTPYNITNNAGNQTELPIEISVDTSSLYSDNKIRSDCGDIRFVFYNETSGSFVNLSYWNEPCNITGNTNYIVKVPFLENNTNTTIYMYYGNGQATSQSNSGAVFVFFEDFSEGDINGWNIVGTECTTEKLFTYYSNESGSDSCSPDQGGTCPMQAYQNYSYVFGGDDYFDYEINLSEYDELYLTAMVSGMSMDEAGEETRLILYDGVSEHIIDSYQGNNNVWTKVNGSVESSWTTENSSIRFDAGSSDNSCDDYAYVDLITLRKYVTPFPSVSTGSEQHIGSRIINKNELDYRGYFLMKIQKNSTGTWQDVETVINDVSNGTLRVINNSNFSLAQVWNPVSWSTSTNEAGHYRVYAQLTDLYGNFLYNIDNTSISGYSIFEIEEPDLLINITIIRLYEVTDSLEANWHFYTSDFVDSGLNKTFNIYKNRIYRFEVDVNNYGNSSWNIDGINATYLNLNNLWDINEANHVWYSNSTTISNRRTDNSYKGGTFSGTLKWNTSNLGGIVSSGNTATFFFIVNTSTEEDRSVNFKISHADFIETDYSGLHITYLDETPPTIYNNIYSLTNNSIYRGNSTKVYGRWDETITYANATYTTTSPTTWAKLTNTSPQNSGNWTNFTISSTSTWFLGVHQVKLEAKDESNNWNATLPYLNLTVWGKARVTEGNLNTSLIYVNKTVRILCRVTDPTKSGTGISSYLVKFYNSTSPIGNATTNSTGWAYFDYTDYSPGQENLKCNITSNLSRYYKTDSLNYKSFPLTTKENVTPYYTGVSGPSIVHKGQNVIFSTYWHDNYLLGYAKLSVNTTGVWTNTSTKTMSSTDYWANFTYQIPTSMTPGYMQWRQYGNDSFGNKNQTGINTIEVWGWSSVTGEDVNPGSIQENNYTTMSCRIIDSNSSTGISGYPVYFWIKNSTESNYNYLGSNTTNSTGYTSYTFNVTQADTYTVRCNITDDATKKYNNSADTYGIDALNVVSGADTTPPTIVGGNYAINDSEIYRGGCVLVSALWDESINYSEATYDVNLSEFDDYYIPPPYMNDWTNVTICANNSWETGNHSVKLSAKDQEGNLNDTLDYINFVVWGRAQLSWISPQTDQDRGYITLICRVVDNNTGQGVSGYSVKFHDGDLGIMIGSNTTNSTGYAKFTYDYSNHYVGPDQMACEIDDDNSNHYKVYGSDTVYKTINLYGTLNSTITLPTTSQILHRGKSEHLVATVLDEKGITPKNQYGATATLTSRWYNTTGTLLVSNEDTYWTVPSTYPLGSGTLIFNVTAQYYHPNNDTKNILIYGYSKVDLSSPTGGYYKENVLINTLCKVFDNLSLTGIQNYPVTFYEGANNLGTNTTNSTGYTSKVINTSSLSEGQKTLKCQINNNATLYYNRSSVYEDTVQITVDKTNPQITYNPNTDDNGTYSKNWVLVNVSIVETNINAIRLYWNGVPETVTNSSGNNYWINKTGLDDDTYLFYVYVNDSAGNYNQTYQRNVTLDDTPPVVDILSPENKYYNTTLIGLNYTLSEDNKDSCWYKLDAGSNQTLPTCQNSTLVGLSQGPHTVTVYSNDTAGNMDSDEVNFTVDLTSPLLNITSPVNETTYTTNNVDLNFSTSDNYNVSTCWYILDGGGDTELTNCENTTLESLSNTNHTLTVYINDSAGNINSSYSWFVVNFSVLVATPIYPENNSEFASQTTSLNVTTNKPALECNYSVDGGLWTAMTNYTELDWNATVTSLSETTHNATFICSDGLNVSQTGYIYFTVDVTGPIITFVSPTPPNNTGVDQNYTYINASLNEEGHTLKLEWHNSTGKYNFTMNKASDTSFWYNITNLPDAKYNYTVYANDTLGNPSKSAKRIVIISTLAPAIMIQNPENTMQYNDSVISLNVTASKEINLWHFVLNGENFSFEPNTTFAAKIGTNTLTVYGTDYMGKTGNSSVTFYFNGTVWRDTFDSFTGLDSSDNLKTGENASIDFCWPLLVDSGDPQEEAKSCWDYRKEINLSTASNLTNYQLMLSLNLSSEVSSGKADSNCSDIRFSYYNQTSGIETELNYWVEDCNNLNNATVWIRVPKINSTTKIYLYYGNPDATSGDNPTGVFELFDNFETISSSWGSDYTKWETSSSIAYPTQSDIRLLHTYTFSTSYATELRFKGSSGSGFAGYYRFGNSAGTKNLRFYLDPVNNRVDLYNNVHNYYTINSSAFQKYTLVSDFTNNNYTLYINHSKTPAISLTTASGGSSINPIIYSYPSYGIYIDWIAVRKYSITPPSVQGIGTEETAKVNATIKSIAISPVPFGEWNKFKVYAEIPSGTNITFKIINSTNHSVCGDLTYAQVSAGYLVCNDVKYSSPIYLYSDFTTNQSELTPYLINWSISWLTEINDSINPVVNNHNATPQTVERGENITIYANVTDNIAVLKVTVEINGANNTLQRIGSTDIFKYNFDTSTYGAGNYTYIIYANDLAGNNATPQEGYFLVNVSDPDFVLSSISFSDNLPKESDVINISINISETEGVDGVNIPLQLNVSLWNGTTWILEDTKSRQINITGETSKVEIFNHTMSLGTHNFTAYIDADETTEEIDETNNILSENLSISSWGVYYGETNNSLILADPVAQSFSLWIPATQTGNLYFLDYDSVISFSSLKALNATNSDFEEADSAMNMTGFGDSVENMFDLDHNNVPDYVSNFTVAGEILENVPIIPSTNNTNFITGLLWDSSDGGQYYNGTQDLVIVTKVNADSAGQYGTYDYEVKVPSRIKSLKGSINLVKIYIEIN